MLPIEHERIGEVFAANAEPLEPGEQKHKAPDRRHALRQHRRPAGAGDAHLERYDEQKVKPDVEHRRDDEEDERRAAVAYRAQHRRAEIVKYRGDQSPIDRHDVVVRIADDVVRGLHEFEKRHRRHDADRRQNHRKHRAEQNGRSDAAPHPLFVLCSEELTRLDRKAGGQTLHESYDEKGYRARRADARERVVVDRLTDDDRVDHTVKLLENIADEDRYREQDYIAQRFARSEVVCHTVLPLKFVASKPSPRQRKQYYITINAKAYTFFATF